MAVPASSFSANTPDIRTGSLHAITCSAFINALKLSIPGDVNRNPETFKMGTDDNVYYQNLLRENPHAVLPTEAERRKFEADKALKEKSKPPPYSSWTLEQWQAARKATSPPRQHPVIVTSSGSCPFTSPEKIQEITGLSSISELRSATRATSEECKEPQEPEDVDKVDYVKVDIEVLLRIDKCTEGEEVFLWIDGWKKHAWLAHSMKQKPESEDRDATKNTNESERA